jgi:methionyl-tRNA synthetase
LIATDSSNFERIISSCLYGIISANLLLSAIMPVSSETIFKTLGLEISNLKDLETITGKEFTLKKPENLFNRI